jgi:hypothetical protein
MFGIRARCGHCVVAPEALEKKFKRQVKEILKAKAGVLLLEAAATGQTFLLPKFLDVGIPIPEVDPTALSVPDLFTDMDARLAEQAAKPGWLWSRWACQGGGEAIEVVWRGLRMASRWEGLRDG